MIAMVFGDTSDNVDEVISPRFLFCLFLPTTGLQNYGRKPSRPRRIKAKRLNTYYYCFELKTVTSMIEEPFEINDTFLIPYEGEYDEPEVYIPDTLYVPKGTKNKYKKRKDGMCFII